jgi:hypothetical protein
VEIHELKITPADFFTGNPSLDVPSNKNLSSKLVPNGTNGVHKTDEANGCCKELPTPLIYGPESLVDRSVTSDPRYLPSII